MTVSPSSTRQNSARVYLVLFFVVFNVEPPLQFVKDTHFILRREFTLPLYKNKTKCVIGIKHGHIRYAYLFGAFVSNISEKVDLINCFFIWDTSSTNGVYLLDFFPASLCCISGCALHSILVQMFYVLCACMRHCTTDPYMNYLYLVDAD